MSIHQLLAQSKETTDILSIEATVTTGFEFLALDECREKCKPLSVTKSKGRIFFNIHVSDFKKVLSLRSVDNVLLVIQTVKQIPFEGNKENDLQLLKSLVNIVNWDQALNKWKNIIGFKGDMYPYIKKDEDGLKNTESEDKKTLPIHLESISSTEDVCIDKEVCKKSDDCSLSNSLEMSEDNANNILVDSFKVSEDKVNTEIPNSHKNVGTSILECTVTKTSISTIQDASDLNRFPDKNISSTLPKVDLQSQVHNNSFSEPNILLANAVTYTNTISPINDSHDENTDETNCDLNCDIRDNETNVNKSSDLKVISCDVAMEVSDKEMNNSLRDTNEHSNEGIDFCDVSSLNISTKNTVTTLENKKGFEKKQSRGRNRQFDQRKSGMRGGRRNQRGSSTTTHSKPYIDDGILKFRATCYRIGEKHSFSSMEASCEFGGTLQDKFGWTVDLTRFDLNVVLNIENRHGYICLGVTKESLHRRNITHFNSTTLRATMCYNLLRLAEPMTGEIVIDPLCGGGSISIEGALSFPNTYHICGDYNEKAVERTRANINYINKTQAEIKAGPLLWNVKQLPLKPQSVDILVTDLPFGRRSGSKQDNQKLYSRVLFELAKVIKTGTGRACLMSYDKTSLIRALRSQNAYWREIKQFGVNQGGLFSTVFLLLRKATAIIDDSSSESNVLSSQKKESLTLSSQPGPQNVEEVNIVTDSDSQRDTTYLKDEKHPNVASENLLKNDQSAAVPETILESNQSACTLEIDSEINQPTTTEIISESTLSV